MGYAKPLEKAACLLLAAALALGSGAAGPNVARAYGDTPKTENPAAAEPEHKDESADAPDAGSETKPEAIDQDAPQTTEGETSATEGADGVAKNASEAPDTPVEASGITIDETTFPDASFRAYAKEIAGGDVLAPSTVDATKILYASERGIADLTGIQYFTALEILFCDSNPLASLDVSANKALAELYCSDAQLASLDVSANTALKVLDCTDNRLTSLDLKENQALARLYCSGNQLACLDLSANSNLEDHDLDQAQLINVPAASDPFDLKSLDPAIDGSRIKADEKDLGGATLSGTELSGFTPGTSIVYHYDTGLVSDRGETQYLFTVLEIESPSDLTIRAENDEPAHADDFEIADDGTLVITGSGSYTVKMASGVQKSKNRIVVKSREGVAVTLEKLTLRNTGGSSIEIAPEAGAVKLNISGKTSLEPQEAGAGILKRNGEAQLTLDAGDDYSDSTLTAIAQGVGFPGIGSAPVEGTDPSEAVCKNIRINGLHVIAKGSPKAAGIGGASMPNGGVVSGIHIEDSTVEATGGSSSLGCGSGIGSGQSETGQNQVSGITIKKSTVTARGGYGAAGIGAGPSTQGSTLVVNMSFQDSRIAATGGKAAAGIGSGWTMDDNAVSNITVQRCEKMETKGGVGSPGIGSGYSNAGNTSLSKVVIEDSDLVAQGGASHTQIPSTGAVEGENYVIGAGAGIGSGWANAGNSLVDDIAIRADSNVNAIAGIDTDGGGAAPGIGSGCALQGASTAHDIVLQGDCIVAQGGTTTASGDIGPAALPAVGAGNAKAREARDNAISPDAEHWAYAWKGATEQEASASDAFVAQSTERTSLDEISDAYLKVRLTHLSTLSCTGTDDGYRFEVGTLVITGSGTYTLSKTDTPYADWTIAVAAGASPTVVLDGVRVDVADEAGRCAFDVKDGAGDTTILLAGENVLLSGNGRAGIQKSGGDAKLTVSSVASGGATDGSLEVRGGDGAAGIGAGKAETGDADAANIEIAGGTVRAIAGHIVRGRAAAGIGGGCALDPSGNAGARFITVSGGNVYAQGSNSNYGAGAGIGGGTAREGSHSNASDILVSGGVVKAIGGNNGAAGIGSGSQANGSESVAERIDITGGNVTATGGNGAAGIGSGFVQAVGGESRAENVSVSGGTVEATAGNIGGGAGIGSGEAVGGSSIARAVAISGGTVTATGSTGFFGENFDEFAIQGGAGIGSGNAAPRKGSDKPVESRAEGITISGGAVKAVGGSNSPGIGSGTSASDSTFTGSSAAVGIRLTGGIVAAIGGLTHAREPHDALIPGEIASAELIGELAQMPAVGTGLAVSRACEDTAIAPGAGLMVSAWKGASAENAAQFLKDSLATTSIAETKDPYLRAEFSSAPAAPLPPADDEKTGAQALASTGDPVLPAPAIAVLALAGAAGAIAARKRRRS